MKSLLCVYVYVIYVKPMSSTNCFNVTIDFEFHDSSLNPR